MNKVSTQPKAEEAADNAELPAAPTEVKKQPSASKRTVLAGGTES